MFLKTLEAQGFKSFPDKTVLTFEKGITAVVGPNGSGKSNIADAISWVLGEQSTKQLRGEKMEDVIFNGTAKRNAQGMASVTICFDNKDRSLSCDSDEVYILPFRRKPVRNKPLDGTAQGYKRAFYGYRRRSGRVFDDRTGKNFGYSRKALRRKT